jgi:transcriptional regulator with XRE-family HTH domain
MDEDDATALTRLIQRLRSEREARGLTLNEVARRSSVIMSTISEVRAELGPGPRSGDPIGRRLGVGEDLLQCPPALADFLDQDPAANISPQLHVSAHLWASGIVRRRGDPIDPRSPSLSQRRR